MLRKSASSKIFVVLMVVGIFSLAFRTTLLETASSTVSTTQPHRDSSLEFTIAFRQRQDVLLATSPEASMEMYKYMKRKQRSERLARNEESASLDVEADDEDEPLRADDNEEYQDDDGVAEVQIREADIAKNDNALSAREESPRDEDEESLNDDIPFFAPEMDRALFTDSSLPYCTREQVIDGQWYRVELKHPPYVIHTVHLRCYPKEAYYTSPWPYHHDWIPHAMAAGECRYPDTFFDREAFCHLVDSATISIIGDSLSWEHYRSLLQLNGLHPHQNFQHQSRELETNVVHRICNGRAAAIYKRDDKLSNVTASIEQNFPTILVLNRGAHFVPEDELMPGIRRVIGEVQDWLTQCEKRGLQCHFFWRTSVPGHPNCSEAEGPVNDLEKMEALIEDLGSYNERSLTFHWYDYQKQNELVIAEFRKANLASFEVLDGYYLLVRRPDEHRTGKGDCLHNCYPGKVDVYSQLLWHYLQSQRSEEAIAIQAGQPIPEDTVYDLEATEEARKKREAAKKAAGRKLLVR